MKILNYRLGFATNSSSTHSIIICPPDYRGEDYQGEGEYEWDNFQVFSPEEKDKYLVALIMSNLYEKSYQEPDPREKENGEVCAFVEELFPSVIGTDYTAYYVDHQSRLLIPREFGKSTPSREWVQNIRDVLQSPNVGIFGGNDNDDSPSSAPDGKSLSLLPEGHAQGLYWVTRKDNDWWVLFNQEDGTKMRIQFGDLLSPYKTEPKE